MNPQQAENLRILIRHMETKVTRTLNMGRVTGDCGTPACAFGEAACMPHFNAIGLSAMGRSAFMDVLWQGRETCLGAIADEIFGTDGDGFFLGGDGGSRARLFGASMRNAWKRNDVAPKEWAIEARKVLAENGYSMDDGFGKFLDKLTTFGRAEDFARIAAL